jgi:hypothetical protein
MMRLSRGSMFAVRPMMKREGRTRVIAPAPAPTRRFARFKTGPASGLGPGSSELN